MADISQLERALINADAAGDTESAGILAAEIRRMRSGEKKTQPVKVGKEGFADALKETLQQADWGTRNIAGAGTALSNLWEGAKQLVGKGDQQRIEANRMIAEEAPVGALAGNVAAYAPLALVPGANTIAGGAALGALSGAVQPTIEGESRLSNALVGGVAGGAVPAALRAGKTIKAAVVDPFTEAGRNRIAGGVINRAAADPAAVMQRLQSAQGATPGFSPSVGQAAGDAGLASLERTVRAIDPKAWDKLDSSQRAALADAVRNIAGDPIQRGAAVEARRAAAKQLYDQALDQSNQAELTPWLKGQITQLLKRPSINQASREAQRLAMERGEKPSAAGSLRALHDVKTALDDAISQANLAGKGGEVAALSNTKDQLLTVMEKLSPAYQQARQTYAQMSQPINQMDIGQTLAERFIPALYRDMPAPAQLNSASLARALIDQGDDIARSVTGMGGAKLEKVMTPEQMASLRGVLSDAQMMKAAEMAGKGVGSDTVQKTAMSHIAAEAGVPNWLSSIARVPGGWAKRAGDVLYGNSDEAVRMRLAELLTNPQEAASAMGVAGAAPSQLAEALKRIAIGAGQSSIPMLTAQ